MTRRRVLLLGSVAVVATLVAASWLVPPPPPPITKERIAHIQLGTTRSEVVALLGLRATKPVATKTA